MLQILERFSRDSRAILERSCVQALCVGVDWLLCGQVKKRNQVAYYSCHTRSSPFHSIYLCWTLFPGRKSVHNTVSNCWDMRANIFRFCPKKYPTFFPLFYPSLLQLQQQFLGSVCKGLDEERDSANDRKTRQPRDELSTRLR